MTVWLSGLQIARRSSEHNRCQRERCEEALFLLIPLLLNARFYYKFGLLRICHSMLKRSTLGRLSPPSSAAFVYDTAKASQFVFSVPANLPTFGATTQRSVLHTSHDRFRHWADPA